MKPASVLRDEARTRLHAEPICELLVRCVTLKDTNKRGHGMPAEANVIGMARTLYLVAGIAFSAWGLWGADQGWTQWTWMALGGLLLVLGIIGYSPLHSILTKKNQKAN
ncbi:MAG TPA: YgaP-like transmembrane domain [Candidatus Acidoferrales bacterium]|nr:YgaP-like transmembrane domain [Candidatus Acidoferrales bacterium]